MSTLPSGLKSTHAYTVYHLITEQPFRSHLNRWVTGSQSSTRSHNCWDPAQAPPGRSADPEHVHPSPDKRQSAENEETQERQNETEKEGAAWPQPELMAPGGPCPEHCFFSAPAETSSSPGSSIPRGSKGGHLKGHAPRGMIVWQ